MSMKHLMEQEHYLKQTLNLLGVTKIHVGYTPSYGRISGTVNGKPLGTYDGQVYALHQDTPDDDERGLHGRN